MKNKKILLFPLLGACLLTGCNINIYDIINSSNSNSYEQKTEKDLSSLKEGKLLQAKVQGSDYVAANILSNDSKISYRTSGSIPFVSLETLLPLLGPEGSKITEEINGSIHKYTITTATSAKHVVTADTENDTLTFDDYDRFTTMSINYSEVNGISSLAESKGSYVTYSETNPCEYTSSKATVFDFKSHSLDVIAYGKETYIPFAPASDIFFSSLGLAFAYNGEDFYTVTTDAYLIPLKGDEYQFSSYAKSFYNGSLKKGGRTSEYATYNYNALCFQIDYFYGFADKGFAPLDTYLANKYSSIRKNLKSTDNDDYQYALNELLYGILGDGHTGALRFSSIFGNGQNEVSSSVYSDRYISLSETGSTLALMRKASLGNNPSAFSTYGHTAIIRFDSFVSTYKNFTSATVSNYVAEDSFAMLYSYMKRIDSMNSITHVVLDLSINGGGAADACIAMLGFLTNSVNINIYNPLSGSKTTLHYAVDTNLDGKVDANDVKSNYKFFVLTSNYSFSCANLFPTVCKESGIAKIIGEKSGGGACVVRPSVTADGSPFQMSGTSRLSTKASDGSFKDNDAGIDPDYTLERAYFYNDKSLSMFVESK